MKLNELKKQLELKQSSSRISRLKKEYQDQGIRLVSINQESNFNNLKIIGVTGSKGKSTVSYLLHQYLKSLGYKSILYSSIQIDSPTSIIDPNESCEVSIYSLDELLSVIEEVESYKADYLIIEVNESMIKKGIFNDIPFDIKVLTNINPKHNEEEYSIEEYVNIKKSFFKNANENTKCIFGLEDNVGKLYNEFLTLNDNEKVTFSSKHIANCNEIELNKFDFLLTELESNLDGLTLTVTKKDTKEINLKTNLLMNYNALNIVCLISILDTLEVLNVTKLQELLKDIQIPGRVETYKVNGRTIIIDPWFANVLDNLSNFKIKGLLNKIKVVVGSAGYGFIGWDKKYHQETYQEKRKEARKYACELLNKYVDYVYLTENDNAKEDVNEICKEMQSYLTISSIIIPNRKEAIKEAIEKSNLGDVILIAGRGNQNVLCNTSNTMKLLKDSDVVKDVIQLLGW